MTASHWTACPLCGAKYLLLERVTVSALVINGKVDPDVSAPYWKLSCAAPLCSWSVYSGEDANSEATVDALAAQLEDTL